MFWLPNFQLEYQSNYFKELFIFFQITRFFCCVWIFFSIFLQVTTLVWNTVLPRKWVFYFASFLLFKLRHNGRRYETLGISELRTYQPISTLPASDASGKPITPNVLYRVLYVVRFYFIYRFSIFFVVPFLYFISQKHHFLPIFWTISCFFIPCFIPFYRFFTHFS